MFVVHASTPPISIVELANELTNDDVEMMRVHYSSLHSARSRFAAVVDCRRTRMPTHEIRSAIAEMSNSFTDLAASRTICVVVLLDSSALIAALNSLRFLLRSAVEIRCFSTATRSVTWLGERLSAEGILLDDQLIERLYALDEAASLLEPPTVPTDAGGADVRDEK